LYGLPALVLAPLMMGTVSYSGGLQLMLVGALNIHHVILDSAIWKLRNARIAGILIRGAEQSTEGPPTSRTGVKWLKPIVLASGAIGVFIILVGTIEAEYEVPLAVVDGDARRLEAGLRRLKWIGQDDPIKRVELGILLSQGGDADGAIREFRRSISIMPSPMAWINIGALHERAGKIDDALAAYEAAIELNPYDVAALHYAGRASLKAGNPERARAFLERAVSLAPDRADIRKVLDEAASS
jgi:tetratricopeptide (TPR) repeat protein